MNHKRNQQSQSQDPRKSTEQRSPTREEKKELTLEDLASVTGGFQSLVDVLDPSAKAEDGGGNKAEAG